MLSEPYLNEQKDLKTIWKKTHICPATDHRTDTVGKRSPIFLYFRILHYNSSSASICLLSRPKKNPKKCHCTHTPGSIPDICHGQQFKETKVAFCTVSTGESGESAILFVQVKYSAPGDEWRGCMARLCSDGNGTDNHPIFQHHAENQENEVKQEHGGAQRLVHLPITGRDGNDDKEKHDKEQHNSTEEPITADGDWSQAVDG